VEHRGDKDGQGTALFSTASLPLPLFFLRFLRRTRAPARRGEISAERGKREKGKRGRKEKEKRKKSGSHILRRLSRSSSRAGRASVPISLTRFSIFHRRNLSLRCIRRIGSFFLYPASPSPTKRHKRQIFHARSWGLLLQREIHLHVNARKVPKGGFQI